VGGGWEAKIVTKQVQRALQVLMAGLLFYSAHHMAGAQAVSPSREGLRNMLADADPDLRAYAAYNLGHRYPEEAAHLLRLTSDRDPLVRRAAVFSLGLVRYEPGAGQFLRGAKDPHYGVRRAAVFALGNVPSAKSVEGLTDALKDGDFMVRQLAVLSLAHVAPKSSLPKLIPMLEDESPRVRRTTACVLGVLRAPSAIPSLRRLYRDRKRAQPPDAILRKNNAVQRALDKKLNLSEEFLHFMETLTRLSQAASVEVRVDDEVLFKLNTAAADPQNLDNIRLVMWKVPFGTALGKVADTAGAYYYVESGMINISSKRQWINDTPVLLEVAGAMALLGDRGALTKVRQFLEEPRFRRRARQLLQTITGR
jgi:HEAT repeat protein